MSALKISVTEARRRWSEILDRAERGEAVEITRRGKPAARFVAPVRPVAAATAPSKRSAASR